MHRYQSTGEIHDLAPGYALGALDETERVEFENHLRQGCDLCEAEARAFGEISVYLADSAAAEPPPSLRARLAAKAARAPQAPGILLSQGGLLISRSAELAWQPLAPGIEFKPLYLDSDRSYNTCIVRMDAGARYPSHKHNDVEELFMLSGDLHVAGEVMRSGDYCRADTGTLHGETFSEAGCLFLLLASQNNQVVA